MRLYLAFVALVALAAVVCLLSGSHVAERMELIRGTALWERIQGKSKTMNSDSIIPILVPAFSKARHLDGLLTALANCTGIGKTVVVVSQDGGDADVSAVIDKHARAHKVRQHTTTDVLHIIHLSHVRPLLGLPALVRDADFATSANVLFLLTFAFERMHTKAAIVLQSDLLPSPDMYQYFKWAFSHVASSANLSEAVFTINAFNANSRPQHQSEPYALMPYSFTLWGFLCPHWSWPAMREGWSYWEHWDVHLQQLRKALGRVSLTPSLSRVKYSLEPASAVSADRTGSLKTSARTLQCDVDDDDKEDCLGGNDAEVKQFECFSRGCCWVPERLHHHGPRCYRTKKSFNPLASLSSSGDVAPTTADAWTEQHGYRPTWTSTYLGNEDIDYKGRTPTIQALEWENRLQFAEVMTY